MDEICQDTARALGLDPIALRRCAGRLNKLNFEPGNVVFNLDESFNGIYIVFDGIAKTVLYINECEVVTAIAARSDMLGADALHSPTFVTKAAAVTALTVVHIPTPVLAELLRESNAFRSAVHHRLGTAIADGLDMIRLLARARAEARLAFFLLKVASKLAVGKPSTHAFDIGLTRQEIGCYLGLTVATVSRRLSALADTGYVRVRGKKIRISNRPGLLRISGRKILH